MATTRIWGFFNFVFLSLSLFVTLCFDRAEQEKKLAQQKKEEEERLRKEEADKKAKEAEEKRKRLEEAEKKRQAMMQAQKEKQQAAGQGSKGSVKKADSGVSLNPISLYHLPFLSIFFLHLVYKMLLQPTLIQKSKHVCTLFNGK